MRIERLSPFGISITLLDDSPIEALSRAMIEDLILQHKVVLIRGVRVPSRQQFLDFSLGFSDRRTVDWNVGPVMEMRVDPQAKNYLFSREAVPFHWDGAFHQVPDWLLFSCLETPAASGGETLFANTEMILEEADRNSRTVWQNTEIEYVTEKLAHYGGQVVRKLVQVHPLSGRPVLRYSEPVRTELNPVHVKVLGASAHHERALLEDLGRRIYDPRFCLKHEWRVGDLLFADNHSLLHGRTAFAKDCPRHLRRIQLVRKAA